MHWIHVETKKLFQDHAAIKRAHPNTSFPPGPITIDSLKNLGYESLDPGNRPLPSSDLKVVRVSGAEQGKDNKWYLTYKEVNRHSPIKQEDGTTLSKAEQDKQYIENIKISKITQIRDQRNSLLLQVDIEISKALDNEEDVMPWRKYRKALREMMDNITDPDKVVWPKQPE